ncbi:34502_t:CDS:1, partial [Racocetra persica]
LRLTSSVVFKKNLTTCAKINIEVSGLLLEALANTPQNVVIVSIWLYTSKLQ